MANPWTKKNPFLSMWLSAANQSLGAARGTAQAAARRQVTTAQNDAVRQVMDFWGASAGLTKPRKSRRR
jgi:hypothetical protein